MELSTYDLQELRTRSLQAHHNGYSIANSSLYVEALEQEAEISEGLRGSPAHIFALASAVLVARGVVEPSVAILPAEEAPVVVEESTPVIEESAPVIEESAVVAVEELTPVIEEAAPVVEELPAVDETPVPAMEAPVVEAPIAESEAKEESSEAKATTLKRKRR